MKIRWIVNESDQVVGALIDDIHWTVAQVISNTRLHIEYHNFLKLREKKNGGCPLKAGRNNTQDS